MRCSAPTRILQKRADAPAENLRKASSLLTLGFSVRIIAESMHDPVSSELPEVNPQHGNGGDQQKRKSDVHLPLARRFSRQVWRSHSESLYFIVHRGERQSRNFL